MVLTPQYIINGDITFNNISSISIYDSINDESDAVTIVCNNFTTQTTTPNIEVFIGYTDNLWSVGKYRLQSVNYTEKNISLIFTSAYFDDKMKTKRTKSYQKITLNELCKKIAKKYNLKVKSDMPQYIEHIDQKNESDIALLNRYAQKYNAIFNIKNETLIFLFKTSKKLPLVKIFYTDCSNYNISLNHKFIYKSISIKFHDFKKNKPKLIKIGSGEPLYQIEEIQNNKTEAINIANAKLQQLIAKSKNGYITLEGQNIIAGAKVELIGFNHSLDGIYLITSVKHNISDIFTSSINIEKLPK